MLVPLEAGVVDLLNPPPHLPKNPLLLALGVLGVVTAPWFTFLEVELMEREDMSAFRFCWLA